MRIGHCGDLHITEGARFADGVRAVEFIAAEMARRSVDVALIGGDLTGTQSPHVARIAERKVIVDFARALADHVTVICIPGNHDAHEDHAYLPHLRARNQIYYVDRPAIVDLGALRVACLPFPSKRWAVAGSVLKGGLEEQKAGMESGIRAILAGWSLDAERARTDGVPIVGLMHINIGGSRVTGSEILIGREVELSPHDLSELGFDAGFLSHIHRAQGMAPGWNYAGSPFRQNHGESAYEPGFMIADVESGKPPRFEFVRTPSRRLVTVEVAWEHGGWIWEWQENDKPAPDPQDADVRLRVMVNEADAPTCPTDQLVEQLSADGAHAVQVDRRILPTTRIRSQAITCAKTTAEKIGAYWESLGKTAPASDQRARCLDKLTRLESVPADARREAA